MMKKKTTEKTIKFEDLNLYGFSDDVIQDMIKYDILFPVSKKKIGGEETLVVKQSDVLMFLNRMLKNTMKVYEVCEKVEVEGKKVEEVVFSSPSLKSYNQEEVL